MRVLILTAVLTFALLAGAQAQTTPLGISFEAFMLTGESHGAHSTAILLDGSGPVQQAIPSRYGGNAAWDFGSEPLSVAFGTSAICYLWSGDLAVGDLLRFQFSVPAELWRNKYDVKITSSVLSWEGELCDQSAMSWDVPVIRLANEKWREGIRADVTLVPEPSSLAGMLTGGSVFLLKRRKRS